MKQTHAAPTTDPGAVNGAELSASRADANLSIDWFRHASPYINAHRGKTFVLCFSGTALASTQFPTLIHDITLLHHLGIRLVLVHGLKPQIDDHLSATNAASTRVQGLRITTPSVLDAVVAEVGKARIFIESRLSMGLPNTPMSGSHLSVASGNFITAQPHGIHDGIDFGHTGVVRQVHVNAIRRQIEHGQLVLLSPLGYSLTGELFNLQSEAVAVHAAIALQAEKLIYIDHPVHDGTATPVRETTPAAMEQLLKELDNSHPAKESALKAVSACRSGVQRAHLLDYSDPYALLKELFTLDGSGTMITADTYDVIRQADIQDVNGIVELIRPLEKNGTLVARSREQLELEIRHFHVAERDRRVVACAALIPNVEETTAATAEIACVVTHPDYRNSGRAEKLLQHLETTARTSGINTLFVFTTRSDHWFIEQGYEPGSSDVIPHDRMARVNPARNSRILLKHL